MKSSFELALERTGGNLNKIDDAKKSKIAEIEIKFKSKIAEAELAAKERLLKARGDREKIEQIQSDLDVEIASINSKSEREKNKIRDDVGTSA